MTKDEIIEVIKKNIEDNIDEIDIGTLDTSKSMKDYGANSLDMIEVVSCSMRDLKLKIPRTELADINTIDDLANKFMEHAS